MQVETSSSDQTQVGNAVVDDQLWECINLLFLFFFIYLYQKHMFLACFHIIAVSSENKKKLHITIIGTQVIDTYYIGKVHIPCTSKYLVNNLQVGCTRTCVAHPTITALKATHNSNTEYF